MLSVNEVHIPIGPDGIVELWFVRGIDGYWPTKIVAEQAARLSFFDEVPDKRYARIFFTRFIQET